VKPCHVEIENLTDEKKRRIIHTALSCEAVTRAEIAEICNVSTATVGKVITKLTEAGILSCEKQSLGVGPHTEILSPSQKIKTIFLHLGRKRIALTICNSRQDIILERSESVDESIPYESNLTALAMSAYDELKAILSNSICCVAVAFDKKSFESAAKSLDLVFENFSIDFSMPYNDYLKHFIGKHTDKSIIFVRVSDTIDISLICGDRVFSSENQISAHTGDHIGTLDLSSAVFNIADTIAPLLKILTPDKIILESDTLPIDDIFISALNTKIKERAANHGDFIPNIYDSESLRLALRAASDMTLLTLADILCEK